MSMEEEEIQAKGIENIFNKVIAKNFPKFEKEVAIQVQDALGLQIDKITIDSLHVIS
jgi:hypothetical protein